MFLVVPAEKSLRKKPGQTLLCTIIQRALSKALTPHIHRKCRINNQLVHNATTTSGITTAAARTCCRHEREITQPSFWRKPRNCKEEGLVLFDRPPSEPPNTLRSTEDVAEVKIISRIQRAVADKFVGVAVQPEWWFQATLCPAVLKNAFGLTSYW